MAIDLLLSYPFWIGLVIFFQLFIIFAFLDLLDVSILRFFPGLREWWQARRVYVIITLVVVTTLYSLVTIVRDTWSIQVVERTVDVPEEFKSLSGLRIAQISDVQGDGRTTFKDLRNYVNKVNLLRPDLVLFAGDLVTSGTRYIDSTARILSELRAPLGVVAAVGDHDVFSNKDKVVAALQREGIRILEDTTVFLEEKGTTIALTVVTYTYPRHPTLKALGELLLSTRAAYKILLVHQPAENVVAVAWGKGYDLFLAGHTHGGGLAFGIPGIFLFAPANLESRFVSGLYRQGKMTVSVTNGIGLTLAPIRFNAPAQITLLTLK
jgi:hypothetical protein